MKSKHKMLVTYPRFPLLNATQFACLAGVSMGTVSTWLDERMPCKRAARSGSEVSIDVRKAIPWLAKRRADHKGADHARITKARAEKLEMQNALSRGKVISVQKMRQQVLAAIAFLAQALEALPQRITSDEALQIKIENELRSARDRFADNLESLGG